MKAPEQFDQTLPRVSPPRSSGRGLFLGGITIFAIALVVVIWQVQQPWRGYVVGALLIMLLPSLVLLRFLRHWYHYREFKLWARMQGKDPDVAYTIGWQEPKKGRGADDLNLKVVVLEKTKGGRSRI